MLPIKSERANPLGLPTKIEREELGGDISKRIILILGQEKAKASKLIEIVKDKGFFIDLNFACHVLNGVHTYLPRPSRQVGEVYSQKGLVKLSCLLCSLEVSEDDEIIKKIREKYPTFKYPPELE